MSGPRSPRRRGWGPPLLAVLLALVALGFTSPPAPDRPGPAVALDRGPSADLALGGRVVHHRRGTIDDLAVQTAHGERRVFLTVVEDATWERSATDALTDPFGPPTTRSGTYALGVFDCRSGDGAVRESARGSVEPGDLGPSGLLGWRFENDSYCGPIDVTWRLDPRHLELPTLDLGELPGRLRTSGRLRGTASGRLCGLAFDGATAEVTVDVARESAILGPLGAG